MAWLELLVVCCIGGVVDGILPRGNVGLDCKACRTHRNMDNFPIHFKKVYLTCYYPVY